MAITRLPIKEFSCSLKELVKSLTVGYGESHNYEHAEKVASNTAAIHQAMQHDLTLLNDKCTELC